MTDVVRSVVVRVRGDVSGLERAYDRAGTATDAYADKLERAGENSRLLREEQTGLGTQLRQNSRTLQTYNKHLDKMGSTSSTNVSKVARLSGETRTLERRTGSLGAVSTRSSNQIDRFSGRLVLAAQAAIALGPGLVAGAIVPLAGVAAQAGAAGIGVGVLIGSFQGIKDAVTALNKAELDPTVDNLKAVDTAMADLSPQARRMAQGIQQNAIPVLKALRNEGSQTMFPGVIDGAERLTERLPWAKKLIREVGLELGDLSRDVGANLAGDDWDKIFNHALATTPGLIDDAGRSVGFLARVVANLWVALDPLTQDWSSGLVNGTEKLANASEHLDDSQGFQDFLSYAQELGPDVVATLGQILGMFVAIGRAGAPISGPLIKGLGSLAEIVGDIADSDIGTPLVAGAIALTALNKALTVTKTLQTSSAGQFLFGTGTGAGGGRQLTALQRTSSGLTTIRGRLGEVRKDLGTVATTWGTAGARSERETLRMSSATSRLRTNLSGVAKGGALLGAIAIGGTGAADSVGLTNTAMLALAGSIAGPLGTAAGGGIGALLDMKAAGRETADTMRDLNAAVGQGDFGAAVKNLELFDKLRAARPKSFGASLLDPASQLGAGLLNRNNPLNDHAQAEAARAQVERMAAAYKLLAHYVGEPLPADASPKQIAEFAAKADPLLQRMGYTIEDVSTRGYEGFMHIVGGYKAYAKETDTVASRTQAVADSIRDVDLISKSAADGATQLATSLNSLLTPQLNAEASADNLAAAYDNMRTTLAKGRAAGFTKGTDAGRANRSATRDVVTGIEERLSAAAANGAGSAKLARILQQSRQEFVKEGVAAGFSADAIRKRARELGLTPKLVRTVLRAVGADESAQAVNHFAKGIRALPKKVQSEIATNGVPRTQKEIDTLARKYHLMPKDVRTLASLKDQSSVVIAKIMRRLDELAGRHPRPTVTVNDRATAAARQIQRAIDGIRGKTVNININTIRTESLINKRIQNHPGTGADNARGGFYTAYAEGGMDRRDAHQPEMAGPGPTRVWREPETGGESYIPHANDSRRSRAKAITERTANLFGGNVTWHANGSLTSASGNQILTGNYQLILPAGTAALVAKQLAASARETAAAHLDDLHAQQQIRDIQKQLAEMEGKKGHRHHTLRGLDRETARAELAQARRDLQALRSRTEATATLTSAGDIFARGTGAQSAVSSINRTVADIGEYGSVVARLKAAGASPALLRQMVARAESGDFRSAIRLGKALLAQPATLKQLNASLASLQSVSAATTHVTGDPRFLSAKAWNPTNIAPKVVQLWVGKTPSQERLEIARVVRHEVQIALAGAS